MTLGCALVVMINVVEGYKHATWLRVGPRSNRACSLYVLLTPIPSSLSVFFKGNDFP
jgi:hypothetical protein